jgi:hypothetical protein
LRPPNNNSALSFLKSPKAKPHLPLHVSNSKQADKKLPQVNSRSQQAKKSYKQVKPSLIPNAKSMKKLKQMPFNKSLMLALKLTILKQHNGTFKRAIPMQDTPASKVTPPLLKLSA